MFKQLTAIMLSGLLVWAGLTAEVSAAIIETSEVLTIEARDDRIDEIQAKLAREDVQTALTQLGVDPAQAQQRVTSLSDQELVMLERELETLPAGGEFFAVVGVVFVVLIILELVGVTNIFTRA